MTSTTTDRRIGVYGGVAIKTPCRVATTANITLSGLQTIDGVVVVANDRVLVKSQTSGIENGIYSADTGAWSRTLDFNGSRDCVEGTLVMVVEGTANADNVFHLSTSDPTIGTDALTFSLWGDANRTTINYTSDQTLTADQSGRTITNLGASGTVILTLPTAVAGLQFTVIVAAAQTVVVDVGGSVKIGIDEMESTAGGNASANSPYSSVTLKALSATLWAAIARTGTWTLA